MLHHYFLDSVGGGETGGWTRWLWARPDWTHRINGSQVIEGQVDPGQVLWMLQEL